MVERPTRTGTEQILPGRDPRRVGDDWPVDPSPRKRRVIAGACLVVVAVAGLVVLALVDRRSTAVAADGYPTTRSAPRPTTTTSTTTTSTTTTMPATTTTEEPTTTAAPTVDPGAELESTPPVVPAPPKALRRSAPTPQPAPQTRPPLTVLVVGDSTGFTASFPILNDLERPPYIRRIDTAAVIGCGVLHEAGYTPVDSGSDGAGGFGDCPSQASRELVGLAKRPTWMVVFSGAWEHLPWIPPGATEALPPGSPQLREAIRAQLVSRGNGARSIGTRTAFVAWACPSGVAATRTGEYARWYDQILRDAAAAVPGAIVVEPTDRVCVGGDPGGSPTAEKDAAYAGGHHPQDRRWLWNEWLGPALLANS